METGVLYTGRCVLRPIKIGDAGWLNDLFKCLKTIPGLEGLELFCASVSDTESFISKFNKEGDAPSGFLWSITVDKTPIGFISIYDLEEKPFYSYGLFPAYRHKGYFHGILDRCKTFIDSL